LKRDIRVSTQAFWFPPLSFSAQAKLLQAPSGHACKGCWPADTRLCRCSRIRFSR